MEGTLRLWTSNRLEVLCDQLAALLRDEPAEVFCPEVVVVQSRGMERWLRLELSRPSRLGVCANMVFPFPNRFLADVTEALLPGRFDSAPFDRDCLAWRILRLLPALSRASGFETVRSYLEKSQADDARLYDFAWSVADRLDQYVLYRPDLVLRWEVEDRGDWQAELWRAISRDVAAALAAQPVPAAARVPVNRAALRRALLAQLGGEGSDAPALPFRRVSVFGVSVLPPFHLSVLHALSRLIPVDLFLLNPSQEYWSLAMSVRRQALVLRAAAEAHPERRPPDAVDQALDSGNALLASLGRLGQAFFDDVISREPEDEPSFLEPGVDSVLHVIQTDILHMVDRRESGEHRPLLIDEADRSLSFHACHSAMREAEVLHDFLLGQFQLHPKMRPGDVLVMSPDIDTYGPVIQAVFEGAEDEGQRIPIAVSDRPLVARSILARTVSRILALPESRCAASEVLALVDDSRVREHFGIGPGDPELIAKWVREAGIRWGLDGGHRAELDLPPERQNTWEAGLERLLLGFSLGVRASAEAMDDALYRGILPTDGPEGSEATLLGCLVDLYQAIRQARVLLSGRHEPGKWAEVTREALSLLLGPDLGSEEEAEAFEAILRAVARDARLAAGAPAEAGATVVGVGAIRAALERRLGDERASGRFLTGRVTVCKMEPMRSIPAKLICLVGMDAGLFPARERSQGFDLMAQDPLPGDRSRVAEDRYLFLETILSARSTLYVSYVGQSIKDNTDISPSVPVSLLLDYAEQAFRAPQGTVRTRLVVKHPLQPWSARYLRRPKEASAAAYATYSRRNALAARALMSGGKRARHLCAVGLPPPQSPSPVVELDDLIRFLVNPSRHFVRRRLGFSLEEPAGATEDREPFLLGGLDRYRVEHDLLSALLRGAGAPGALAAASRALRAEGRLPHGALGALEIDAVGRRVEDFRERLAERQAGTPRPGSLVTVLLPEGTVQAVLPPSYGSSLVAFRWGRLRAVDRIGAWLTHLLAAASGTLPSPWSSVFLATDHTMETADVPEARELLSDLLRAYREGWCRPLPFFPESSLAYAKGLLGGDPRAALARARAAWEATPWSQAEADDPYFHLCFGDEADPLGNEFQGLASAILTPCVAAQALSKKGAARG